MRMVTYELPTIEVDEAGFDKDGFDYTWSPTPRAVAEGLVVTRDVLLHFPDDTVKPATEILITKKGMARIAEGGSLQA